MSQIPLSLQVASSATSTLIQPGAADSSYARETHGLGTGFLAAIFIPLANDALKGNEMLRYLPTVWLMVSATGALAHGVTAPAVENDSAAEIHSPITATKPAAPPAADPVAACTGRARSAACEFLAQGDREFGTCEAPQEQKNAKARICLPFAKQIEDHPSAAGGPVKSIAKKGN